jgi:hypothetical protein
MANDDAQCTGGDWADPSGRESAVVGVLEPGTYRLAVGSCTPGNFTLHVQHVSPALAARDAGRLPTGRGRVSGTLTAASRLDVDCSGLGVPTSGEDFRWYVACGGESVLFSLCPSDGGTFSRARALPDGEPLRFDPEILVWNGFAGRPNICNDDGDSTLDCTGTGGDAANYGSRLHVPASRGLNAILVDERHGDTLPDGTGMTYTLAYTVP